MNNSNIRILLIHTTLCTISARFDFQAFSINSLRFLNLVPLFRSFGLYCDKLCHILQTVLVIACLGI